MRRAVIGMVSAALLGAAIVGCGPSSNQQADTRLAANGPASYPPPETSVTVQRQGLRKADDSEAVKKSQPTTGKAEDVALDTRNSTERERSTRRHKSRADKPADSSEEKTPTIVEPQDAQPAGWDDDHTDPVRRIVNGLSHNDMQNLLQGRLTTREVARRIRYNGSERKLQDAIKEIQRGSSNRWRD